MEDNLKLWNKVEKTNPNYTKKANVRGNNITSIAPQYQIKQATEQFGSYGKDWGFKDMQIDYTLKELGLASFKATFYYTGGEFEIINSIQLYRDNAKTKIDSDFAKKLETDTLTKALSKLGFNADIFLGKFEDQRYLEEITKEFAPTISDTKAIKLLETSGTIAELKTNWRKLTKEEQSLKTVIDTKDTIKKTYE